MQQGQCALAVQYRVTGFAQGDVQCGLADQCRTSNLKRSCRTRTAEAPTRLCEVVTMFASALKPAGPSG